MSVTIAGAQLKKMTFDGQTVKKWVHDGVPVFSAEKIITDTGLSFVNVQTGPTPQSKSYTVDVSGFDTMEVTAYSSNNYDYSPYPDWTYQNRVTIDGITYNLNAGTVTHIVSVAGKTSVVVTLTCACWGGGITTTTNVSQIKLY